MSQHVRGTIAAGRGPATAGAGPIDRRPVVAGPDRVSREDLIRFTALDIVVVGDAVIDEWFSGTSRRLCREAPVPLVEVTERQRVPGAGGNTAANIAALGGRVRYFGVVGDDGPGMRLREELRLRGVDDRGLLVDAGRATTVKCRVLAKDQVVARFDLRDPRPWSPRVVDQLAGMVTDAIGQADAVVVSDYDDGATAGPVRRTIGAARDRMTCPLVVDAHAVLGWAGCRPTAVTPSLAEVLDIVGSGRGTGSSRSPAGGDRLGHLLLRRTNASMVVTTMDADGSVLYLPGGRVHRTSAAMPARPGRTIGAGDTFTGAFTMGIAAGFAPGTAAQLGQLAADVVVAKPGTAVCTLSELVGHGR